MKKHVRLLISLLALSLTLSAFTSPATAAAVRQFGDVWYPASGGWDADMPDHSFYFALLAPLRAPDPYDQAGKDEFMEEVARWARFNQNPDLVKLTIDTANSKVYSDRTDIPPGIYTYCTINYYRDAITGEPDMDLAIFEILREVEVKAGKMPAPVALKKLFYENDRVEFYRPGGSVYLAPKLSPANAYVKQFAFTSSDNSIAAITSYDTAARVWFGKEGNVTVTCTAPNGISVARRFVVTNKDVVEINSISLGADKLSMNAGATRQIKITRDPANASNKFITYSSSSPSVVSVDANGKLTAHKSGRATITATAQTSWYSERESTIQVTVGKAAPKSLTLNKRSLDLGRTRSFKLVANAAVTYRSSNKRVCKVDANGRLTALTNGTATITATAKVGGAKASCKVTVRDAVKRVRLNVSKTALSVKQKLLLKASIQPVRAYKGVTFKTSNAKVASVTQSGMVTAKSKGNATITVSANDFSGKKAVCKLTVK